MAQEHDENDVPLPPEGRPRHRRRTCNPGPEEVEKLIEEVEEHLPRGRVLTLITLAIVMLMGIGWAIGDRVQGETSASSIGSSGDCSATITPSYLPPQVIYVAVLNAGSPSGSATTSGNSLKEFGFQVNSVGNARGENSDLDGALIKYGENGEQAANTLKQYVRGDVTLQQVSELNGNSVELYLLPGFAGVTSPDEAKFNLERPIANPNCQPR